MNGCSSLPPHSQTESGLVYSNCISIIKWKSFWVRPQILVFYKFLLTIWYLHKIFSWEQNKNKRFLKNKNLDSNFLKDLFNILINVICIYYELSKVYLNIISYTLNRLPDKIWMEKRIFRVVSIHTKSRKRKVMRGGWC